MVKIITILTGDVIDQLKTLPDRSVHCVVTSPPYYGLRDYKIEGQIGLEKTPEEYTQKLVEVFREVRRVLRDDGTLWLNLGDSYWGGKGQSGNCGGDNQEVRHDKGTSLNRGYQTLGGAKETRPTDGKHPVIKPKDLVGIPWRVAFALQADGWYLRSDIIWAKSNPMPESVSDRPTKSHEYIFLLSKNPKYHYDFEGMKEPSKHPGVKHVVSKTGKAHSNELGLDTRPKVNWETGLTRNRRTVWDIPTKPFKGAHFAVFPEKLIEPCIKAGTSEKGACVECGTPLKRIIKLGEIRQLGHAPSRKAQEIILKYRGESGLTHSGMVSNQTREKLTTGWIPTCKCDVSETKPCVVLDPFGGSGTTGAVSKELNRDAILIELNPEYVEIMKQRLRLHEQLGG